MHPVPKVDPGFLAQHRDLARRLVGLEPFPVQLDAGQRLLGRVIAEMETGEGKTLAAALPLVVYGQRGGAWLATANDYLARRDADLLAPLFAAHGLSVGCIQAGQPAAERQRAYRCPVVYGTLREFGFDHLKDCLLARQRGVPVDQLPDRLQSRPEYLLLDEADSLLIDEATTPLVISLPGQPPGVAETALLHLADRLARELEPGVEFVRQPPWGTYRLTSTGRRSVLARAWPPEVARFTTDDIHTAIERALYCHRELARDVHYVVDRGKVQIVDEGTGRIGVDRQWQAGLHQAVECREGVPLSGPTRPAARITLQEFVRQFPRLAGLTGTARECAAELRGVYRLEVQPIPTRLPSRRVLRPARVCRDERDKLAEICAWVREGVSAGRAVLVGTRTVEASERVSEALRAAGLPHELLNALSPGREAEIIARAGEPGQVTVATNMAGRGTDIRLGAGVAAAGGLLVVGTELHSSARIDRQLAGRCARQGDPGEFRQLLAPGDSILVAGLGAERAARLQRSAGLLSERVFRGAQQRVERRSRQERVALLLAEQTRQRQHQTLGLNPQLDLLEER